MGWGKSIRLAPGAGFPAQATQLSLVVLCPVSIRSPLTGWYYTCRSIAMAEQGAVAGMRRDELSAGSAVGRWGEQEGWGGVSLVGGKVVLTRIHETQLKHYTIESITTPFQSCPLEGRRPRIQPWKPIAPPSGNRWHCFTRRRTYFR